VNNTEEFEFRNFLLLKKSLLKHSEYWICIILLNLFCLHIFVEKFFNTNLQVIINLFSEGTKLATKRKEKRKKKKKKKPELPDFYNRFWQV